MAKLIGWREWASLPRLDLERIKAKLDTGARTSALHAVSIATRQEAGVEWVDFRVQPLQKNSAVEVACSAPVKEYRHVRDSGGREERRVVIDTEIQLGGDLWPIELTLTDRANMKFRMLLGRNAIRSMFYVDPTQSFVLSHGPVSSSADSEEE